MKIAVNFRRSMCNQQNIIMYQATTGRTFSVRSDGTLYSVGRHFDVDDESRNSGYDRPPMKVILSRATSESFKAQLRPPPVRIQHRNINDSVSINDFFEYGSKAISKQTKSDQSQQDRRNYDVRKWK